MANCRCAIAKQARYNWPLQNHPCKKSMSLAIPFLVFIPNWRDHVPYNSHIPNMHDFQRGWMLLVSGNTTQQSRHTKIGPPTQTMTSTLNLNLRWSMQDEIPIENKTAYHILWKLYGTYSIRRCRYSGIEEIDAIFIRIKTPCSIKLSKQCFKSALCCRDPGIQMWSKSPRFALSWCYCESQKIES